MKRFYCVYIGSFGADNVPIFVCGVNTDANVIYMGSDDMKILIIIAILIIVFAIITADY